MKHLKTANLRMLKYLQSNFDRLSSLLSDQSIYVLNDLEPVKTPADITAYLRLYCGNNINLTDLREQHRSVYRGISNHGKPMTLLKDWGFTVSYRKMYSEDMLLKLLSEIRTEDGTLDLKAHRNLYNKVIYRADREGVTVQDYLGQAGLKLPDTPTEIDSEEIVRLKDQGLSFRTISGRLGISKSTAQKRYSKSSRKKGAST
jgi:hypothetical protein